MKKKHGKLVVIDKYYFFQRNTKKEKGK